MDFKSSDNIRRDMRESVAEHSVEIMLRHGTSVEDVKSTILKCFMIKEADVDRIIADCVKKSKVSG